MRPLNWAYPNARFAQGWGMTETVGTGSKNFRSDKKGTGTIGSPVSVEIRIVIGQSDA